MVFDVAVHPVPTRDVLILPGSDVLRLSKRSSLHLSHRLPPAAKEVELARVNIRMLCGRSRDDPVEMRCERESSSEW